MGMRGNNINSVFYAESYHPIQAGSIDGTDIALHDNGVYRALLCSNAGLYDPFGDPKVTGDPYCTLFVGRLSHLTTEDTLRKAMSKYGRVKNLHLVRHIVSGASRGYAFVEYETEREMRRAYEDAHHSFIDDCEIIVDYNRQQLMPGWIPRRLGGGLGGKKESGQLRFGGRERPFRAPLRPLPLEDLKRLGIPPPPEGRYMSRFQVPSPPRRKRSSVDREERFHKRSSMDREKYSHRSSPVEREEGHRQKNSKNREPHSGKEHSLEKEEHYHKKETMERLEPSRRSSPVESTRSSVDREDHSHKKNYAEREKHSHQRRSRDKEECSHKRSSQVKDEYSHKRSSGDRKSHSHKRHKHHHSHRLEMSPS